MQQHDFTLIDGKYSPEDARSVLMSLLSHKINYNQLAAFGAAERGDAREAHYHQRVSALKAVTEFVSGLIRQADAEGMEMRIEGSFTVTLVPAPQRGQQPAAVQVAPAEKPLEYYLA